MRSNFSVLSNALELGIPVEIEDRLWKLIDGKLMFANISIKNGETTEQYMTGGWNGAWDYMYTQSKNLTEEDRINLVHLTMQAESKIEKGHKAEDLTYNYEKELFEKLKGAWPHTSDV